MVEGKLLFRTEEAADRLGVSRARLYELMACGEVRSVKIGSSRRIPAVDLEAFVTRLRSESGTTSRRGRTSTAAGGIE